MQILNINLQKQMILMLFCKKFIKTPKSTHSFEISWKKDQTLPAKKKQLTLNVVAKLVASKFYKIKG